MKKLIIVSALLCSLLFVPVFASAQTAPTQDAVTQQLIKVLTQLIAQLEQEIQQILSLQQSKTSTSTPAPTQILQQIQQNTPRGVQNTTPPTQPIPTQQNITPPTTSLPPLAISNIQVNDVGWRNATISWSTNQTYFTPSIEYGTNSDLSNTQTFSNQGNVFGGIGCSQITASDVSENCNTAGFGNPKGLLPNMTYYFRITEKNNVGEIVHSDILSFKTIAPPMPAKFSLTSSNITNNSVKINWALIQETTDYSQVTGIEYDITNDFANPKKAQDASSSYYMSSSVNIENLVENTTYYYRLGFKDIWGNQFYSDTVSFTTLSQ